MPIQMPAPPGMSPLRPVRDQEITGWRIRLYYWTRNPHVLFWAAMIIIGVGVMLGRTYENKGTTDIVRSFFEKLRKEAGVIENATAQTGADLGPELLKAEPDFRRVLSALERRDSSPEAAPLVTNALQAAKLPEAQKRVALAYWSSLCTQADEPDGELLYLAYQAKPLPYANELCGDLLAGSGRKTKQAAAYYERELAVRPDATELRKKLMQLLTTEEDVEGLAKLSNDAAFQPFLTPQMKVEVAMRQKNWGALWEPLIEMQKENFAHKIPVILTTVAGMVWLILAWQMIQPNGLLSFRVFAPLLAIPLGAASTIPVLFLDAYQSEAWGLKHTGFFFEDCQFFVAGVGVREELCKLLLFLPLVPILLLRGSRLEMVVVAGCVGLGFAVEENISYFRMADPSNAFGRFLTANFFHFAATGLVGLAFCDTVRDFASQWWKFPVVFVAIAAAHGLYDAFIGVPMYVFQALGLSCFILISLGFFRQVARERGAATDQIFPAATLIVGLSALVATIIVCASVEYNLDFALEALAVSAIFMGILVYMFFILFRDGLEADEEVVPNFEPY